MRIKIFGKAKNVSPRETRYAIRWFSNMLLGPKRSHKLEIDVVNMDSVRLGKFIATSISTGYVNDRRPNGFEIEIKETMNRVDYLKAIAHELVHVKQIARNELFYYMNKPAKWRDTFVDDTKVHYYDLPWEIEAHGRELGLWVRYKYHLKKEGISFD